MKFSTMISHLVKEFEKAEANKMVKKPISYALYNTWKWCDTYEKERAIRVRKTPKVLEADIICEEI